MRSLSSKRLAASVILAFLALFVNNLWDARADNKMFNYASLLLTSVQLLVFLTLVYFTYHILGALKEPKKRIAIIIAAVIFITSWFYFLFDYILPPSFDFYVVQGRFLADNYGINWFWMDWGMWVQCITVYLFGLYLYLVSMIHDLFFQNTAKKKAPKK